MLEEFRKNHLFIFFIKSNNPCILLLRLVIEHDIINTFVKLYCDLSNNYVRCKLRYGKENGPKNQKKLIN